MIVINDNGPEEYPRIFWMIRFSCSHEKESISIPVSKFVSTTCLQEQFRQDLHVNQSKMFFGDDPVSL